MRIGTKLFTLVVGGALAVGLAGGTYLAVSRRAARVDAEKACLTILRNSLARLATTVNILDSNQVGSASDRLKEDISACAGAFDDVAQTNELIKTNDALREAHDSIDALRGLIFEDLTALEGLYARLIDSVRDVFLFPDPIVLTQFYTDDYARSKHDLTAVYADLEELRSLTQSLTETIESSILVIESQGQTIEDELAAIGRRSALTAAGVAAAFAAMALLVALAVARTIALPLSAMVRAVEAYGEGDFRARLRKRDRGTTLKKKKNDEILRLENALDGLADRLSASIKRVKESAARGGALRLELKATAAAASEAAEGIGSGGAAIAALTGELGSRVASAGEATTAAAAEVAAFGDRAAEQNRLIDGATVSARAVLGAVGSLATIADRNRDDARRLIDSTESGRTSVDEAFSHVEAAAAAVDDIREMADVIRDIAERTGMLAMNAAIEAAHAGGFGKGFAVVADEISKLAEASNESSQAISGRIQGIVARIEAAAEARSAGIEAFTTMETRARDVASSTDEVASLADDLRKRGDETLSLMDGLRSAAERNVAGAAEIGRRVGELQSVMEATSNTSDEATRRTAAIAKELAAISSSARFTADAAERLGEVSAELDEAIAAFKV